MGEGILSALHSGGLTKPAASSDPPQGLSDLHVVSFVDDVTVEVITVTDYSEVELSTSGEKEETARVENGDKGSDMSSVAEETVVAPPCEPIGDGEEEEEEEKAANCFTDSALAGASRGGLSSPQDASVGPHDCLDCKKKFKFASSLTAHRVIHTGERPHCCSECGRCFSFRQSLDRHRHTHKTGRKDQCACGETLRPPSAYPQHEQKHGEDGAHARRRPTLARHPRVRTDDPNANRPSEGHADDQEAAGRDGELSESDNGEGELQNDGGHTSEHGGTTPGRSDEAVLAKVRTSGRKRKPTMKIQVLNLEKGAQRWKKSSKSGGPELTDLTSRW